MNVRLDWTSAVEVELGLSGARLRPAVLAKLSKSVARLAAKQSVLHTIYLLGVSVGRGMPEAEALQRIEDLTGRWRGIDWRD